MTTEHEAIAPCEECGTRCDRCDERMCALFGPEPRVCGTTCGDCACDCTGCVEVAQDRRDQVAYDVAREAS